MILNIKRAITHVRLDQSDQVGAIEQDHHREDNERGVVDEQTHVALHVREDRNITKYMRTYGTDRHGPCSKH